jgi:hypothetical protein
MGATPRNVYCAALRPLFLSALLALAWLAWGAGTAFASPDDPGQLHTLEQSAGSTLEDAANVTGRTARTGGTARTVLAAPVSLVAAPPAPLQRHLPPVPPTVSGLPGTTAGSVIRDVVRPVSRVLPAPSTVAPVVDTAVNTAVNTAANAADAVLSRAAEAVTAVANTSDPVVTGATEVVDTVMGTLTAVPGVSVPRPLPVPPLPLPPVDPTGGHAAVVHAGTLDPKPAAVALQSTRRSSTPARILQNTQGVDALATTAGSAVAFVQTTATPDTEEPLRLAIPQGQSGSASSGSGGASAHTQADLAGYWSPIRADSGARMPDTAQTLAACPSFDPGSSPD